MWKTFLKNHMPDVAALDFFTVPTVTFRILFVLVILAHERRRVVHVNVTEHPTATWTAQQVIDAFPLLSSLVLSSLAQAQGAGHGLSSVAAGTTDGGWPAQGSARSGWVASLP
jgi:putative transposase